MENQNDFKVEYALMPNYRPYSPFKNILSWPTAFKITLGGTVLGIKRDNGEGKICEFQSPGFSFYPSNIHTLLSRIIDDKECFFKIGDGKNIPLRFSPLEDGNYEIALVREDLNEKIAGFDYENLKPVKVAKKTIIQEFSKYLECMYKDLEKYNEHELLKNIRGK
jgi:hypothetical protein